MTGADRLVAALEQSGVRCVFGLPGTQTVPVFEALRKSRIRTVLATSEVSAAFMAGGWARVTGEPGVCLSIPGPGFTWSLTGLAEALLDSVPLLAITGGPPDTPAGRRFRQQELAQTAVAAPLVKRVLDVDRPEQVAALTRAAIAWSLHGEPGPVLLQLSARAMQGEAPAGAPDPDPALPSTPRPSFEELKSRVAKARTPFLLVGQGAESSAAEVRLLAERLGAPVLTTPAGRGVLPEDHPLALGFDAVAAPVVPVNELLAEADLVLVLGAKLGHSGTAGFGLHLPAERLVQVDASAEIPGANYPVSLAVVAPVREAVRALLESPAAGSSWAASALTAWRSRVRTPTGEYLEPRVAGSARKDAAGFFGGLRRALPRDAVLVLDSGLHQLMARRHFPVLAPRSLLFPSDLQSMGFGIPTAVGARLAAPGRPVVALVGDGGFTMTGLEILSAVRERLDLVVIVFSDGMLGQIRLHQLQDYGAAHAVELGRLDLGLLAAALGARYAEVEDEIEAPVEQALREGGVTLIEVPVGDTARIRRSAAAARVRETLRRAAGPTLLRWVKGMLGRRGS